MKNHTQMMKNFTLLAMMLAGLFVIAPTQAAEWWLMNPTKSICSQPTVKGKPITPAMLQSLFSCRIRKSKKEFSGVHLVDCRDTRLRSLYVFGDSRSSCQRALKAFLRELSKTRKSR